MKNDKIVNAYNAIQPNDEVKNRVFDKVVHKQQRKRPVFKAAVSFAAAAAVICLMAFGSTFLTPQDNSIFVIKAYAMEVQDGSVQLREVDILDTRPEYWGGYINGETNTMYVGLGLRCEGENIENVEFSTGSGFFAKQYIGNLSDISISGVTAMYGPDNQMVMFGTDFDDVGSTITLDKEKANDYLLFWGTSYVENSESPYYPPFPEEIYVNAKVTFSNGKTAQKDFTIDLSGGGSFLYNPSEEQKAQGQEDDEAYNRLLQSIPLDKCEVVPDSEQTLTYGDTYEYHLGSLNTARWPITKETMDTVPFDKDGVFRLGSSLSTDGSDGYIGVLLRNGDDSFTGMVYKVPGELILEYMK